MKFFSHKYNLLFHIYEIFVALLVLLLFVSSSQAANHKKIKVSGSNREGGKLILSILNPIPNSKYIWDLNGKSLTTFKGTKVKTTLLDSGLLKINVRRQRGSKKAKVAVANTSMNVKNQAPSLNLNCPISSASGPSISCSVSVLDPSQRDQEAGFEILWDFGDGTLTSGHELNVASHSYASSGTYSISVYATDKDGAKSDSATKSVLISEGSIPTPTPIPSPTPGPSENNVKRISPLELSDQIISNPGMGWQSGDMVNLSGQDAQGFPNKIAYIKYYWRNLETSPGVFNWNVFEQRLNQAHNSGQKVAFRIVVVDDLVSAPDWLRTLGVPGTWFEYIGDGLGGPTIWTPNFDSAVFLQRHAMLMQALGQRYNNHPDIDSIDIGSVGLWGEWHFGETFPIPPMPSQNAGHIIINHYFQNFPDTPKIAQLEQPEPLSYAVELGAGFRGDCLGNMNWQNRISPPGMYEQRIAAANAQNVWQNAPVHFETCWSISYWINQGWNLDTIFDWALSKHISALNNKNANVPASAIPKVQALLKRIGYRYVLRTLLHPQSASPGQTINLELEWENVGVAVPYRDYFLAFQLRNSTGQVISTLITNKNARNWLPGEFSVEQALQIPNNASGEYTIALALVHPGSGQPALQLASAGRDGSGWYPLSTISIIP